MISIRDLYTLQELDWEMDGHATTLITVEKTIGDDRKLQELNKEIEEQELQLTAIRGQQREGEIEGERYREKAIAVEARLYGGTVRNPRELSDLQGELTQLLALQRPVEDGTLELMEQGDKLYRHLQNLKADFSDGTAQWEAEQASLISRQASLIDEISGFGRQRKNLVAGLDTAILSLYDLLRDSRHGHAVAKVERGMCLGCRVSLPTHEIQRSRGGRELVQCTSCSRILYVS